MSETTPVTNGANEDQVEIIIKNGALKNLKSLAGKFDISEDNLLEIVKKSTGILSTLKDLSGDRNFVVVEDEKGRRFRVDL